MAKNTLPVNFQDDIMNSSMGGKRRYKMINNSDGTISLEDATTYDQVGSNFGASQLNATNQAVNAAADAGKIIDDLDAINNVTKEGYMAGALALKQVNSNLGEDENGMTVHDKLDYLMNTLTPYTSLTNFNHVPIISSYISATNANTQYTHTTNFNIEEGKTYFITLNFSGNKPNYDYNEISRTIDNIELIVGEYSTENADYVVKQLENNMIGTSYFGKYVYVIIKAKKNASIPITYIAKFASSSTQMTINYEYWYCY